MSKLTFLSAAFIFVSQFSPGSFAFGQDDLIGPSIGDIVKLSPNERSQKITEMNRALADADAQVQETAKARALAWDVVLRNVKSKQKQLEIGRAAQNYIAGIEAAAKDRNAGEVKILAAQKWSLISVLDKLVRDEKFSYAELSDDAAAETKLQAGILFSKITATTGNGEPLPNATIVFSISKPSGDGFVATTQIAKTNGAGEVNLLAPGDATGESAVAVGPADEVRSVVVTGNSNEQPIEYQTAKTEKLAVNVPSVPQFKISFAIAADPDNESKPDNPDIQKMKEIEQALITALVDAAGEDDPKVIGFPADEDGPNYRSGRISATARPIGLRDESTYAEQVGAGPSDDRDSRRRPFVLWTFKVPRLQTADGKPIQVTPQQVDQAVRRVARRDDVMLAELSLARNAEATPNDPYFSSRGSWDEKYDDQWGLHRIGFTTDEKSAWPKDLDMRRFQLPPVTVAVIGSGVDFTHPDLLGRMWVSEDGEFGRNFRDGNDDVMDYGGHDTHVAGLIAAEWNNGIGISGINPMARIMALKVADMFGNTDSAAISEAILYAADHGARVINLSYGGGRQSRAEQLAIDYAVDKGVLVVAAAGNQAKDNSGQAISAAVGVMTVAATGPNDRRAGFSNWGHAVEIAAPGLDMLSLRADQSDFLIYVGDNENYKPGSAIVGEDRQLYRAGGTSFAAPLVAGTASLIWSIDPKLSLDAMRRKLVMSTDDIDVKGWDKNTGAGLLNAKRAIAARPDNLLVARITKIANEGTGNNQTVVIHGFATATNLQVVQLQIGFGEDPDEWQSIRSFRRSMTGRIQGIPTSRFNRSGPWTIRLVIENADGETRQSRARLRLR